jgi:hypothetical protein
MPNGCTFCGPIARVFANFLLPSNRNSARPRYGDYYSKSLFSFRNHTGTTTSLARLACAFLNHGARATGQIAGRECQFALCV